MSLLWVVATGSYTYHHAVIEEADPELGLHPLHQVSAVHSHDGGVGQATYAYNAAANRATLSGDIYVEPEHRRKGVATGIVRHIRATHPGVEIDPGEFTHDGLAFWRATQGGQ